LAEKFQSLHRRADRCFGRAKAAIASPLNNLEGEALMEMFGIKLEEAAWDGGDRRSMHIGISSGWT
jgi:hypothetical protein